MTKPCEYCGEVLPEGVDKRTRQQRSAHFAKHAEERRAAESPALAAHCPECQGTGARDSGGVQPWGEAIYVPCDCSNAAPAPVAQPLTPDHGWLRSGPLLYRLTDERRPTNRDEIRVTMANESRTPEACARRAGELFDMITRAHGITGDAP